MDEELTLENVDWDSNNELELISDVTTLDDSLNEIMEDEDEELDEGSSLAFYGAVAGGTIAAGGLLYLIYRIMHGDRIRLRTPIYLERSDEDEELDDDEDEDEGSEEPETRSQKETSKKRLRKKKRRK